MNHQTLIRVVPVAVLILTFAGCQNALEKKVSELDARVAKLEGERRPAIGKSEPEATQQVNEEPALASTSVMPSQPTTPASIPVAPSQQEAHPIIEQHCTSKWPTDFEMRAHCKKQQRESVDKLNAAPPADVPGEAFTTIRAHCQQKWPTDFEMREYCERQQVTGYREAQQ